MTAQIVSAPHRLKGIENKSVMPFNIATNCNADSAKPRAMKKSITRFTILSFTIFLLKKNKVISKTIEITLLINN